MCGSCCSSISSSRCAFPASLLNWLLLNIAVFTPFIREGQDDHRQWEKRFYAQAEAWRNR